MNDLIRIHNLTDVKRAGNTSPPERILLWLVLGFRCKSGLWRYSLYVQISKARLACTYHRTLDITQTTAWYMLHRIREAFPVKFEVFADTVEIDETYLGGKRKNMSNSKREKLEGRDAVGKTAVVAVVERNTKKVVAKVVTKTDQSTLQQFVIENVAEGTTVNTDEAPAYSKLKESYDHATVNHSIKQFVEGQNHTNTIESFWSTIKKGLYWNLSSLQSETYSKIP